MIPQTDPKAGYLAHKTEIDGAIQQVLDSGWYILGREVDLFEQEFAAYLGVSDAIGVGNGTDAIEIALQACGIGAGDAVFTVSHTAVATVAAIERIGATPVVVDIDPQSYTLDPACLADALNNYAGDATPKAVIVVHLYGNSADMPTILNLAAQHQLTVVEDCAQAHGATLNGRMAGTWGDIATFSFYPTKNLGALGDGGMVATNRPKLAENARLLRQYGWRQRYISDTTGGNTRLDELQAAILRVKLRYLDQENQARRVIAQRYDAALQFDGLTTPHVDANVSHVYHQYVIRTERRDELRQFLREQQVGTGIHYPQPVHLQAAYFGRLANHLPHTETAAQTILSLPMYPQLQAAQVDLVIEQLYRWFAKE